MTEFDVGDYVCVSGRDRLWTVKKVEKFADGSRRYHLSRYPTDIVLIARFDVRAATKAEILEYKLAS